AADPSARRRVASEAEIALARAGGAFRLGVSPRLAQLNCLVLDGAWEEAREILRNLPDPGNAFLRREITSASAQLARHQGDAEAAWAQIHVRFPRGPEAVPGDHIHQEGLFLQRLAADLCLDAGALSDAYAWLTAHDAWLAWSGSALGRAAGRVAWARYHLLAGDAARARRAAAAAMALASDPDQPLVRLVAQRLLGEIAMARGDLPAAASHLAVALELASICEAPFERALTILLVAQFHARGANDKATAALEEVDRLCRPLGAKPALARAGALRTQLQSSPRQTAYPAGLTRREVEVLRLLAQRQTDKEIAEALCLGPRTVQSHVGHILGKLAVANRREAAEAATRLGLL
ncbi:MAG: helix-turn-helix transcriptional regulator, partial [Thermomicrobiales bacterium]|nr:helix-turn-helix transcriptional regulator [Thermomicrobiales bacterium]